MCESLSLSPSSSYRFSEYENKSIMPVHRPSRPIASTSNSRKSTGFSINDIIKNDDSAKISPRDNPPPLPSYLPPTSWIPPPTSLDPIVQYQLQYLRHSGRLFDGRFASKQKERERRSDWIKTFHSSIFLLQVQKQLQHLFYIRFVSRSAYVQRLHQPNYWNLKMHLKKIIMLSDKNAKN